MYCVPRREALESVEVSAIRAREMRESVCKVVWGWWLSLSVSSERSIALNTRCVVWKFAKVVFFLSVFRFPYVTSGLPLYSCPSVFFDGSTESTNTAADKACCCPLCLYSSAATVLRTWRR